MRRNLLIIALLTVAVLVFGCSQNDPVQPGSTQHTQQDTDSATKSTVATPQFHTLYWPPPAYPASVMKLNKNTGAGDHVVSLNVEPAPPGWSGVYPGFATPYGLAYDVDGTVYSIHNWFNGVQSECFSQVVKMDLETGMVEAIGPVHGMNFAGPEFDAYGNLYATGFTVGPPEGGPIFVWGDSNLYRFDKTTGEKTLIGDTGHTDWMDLDFDSQGRLWATTGNDLYILDTDTGASTFVTHVSGVEDNRIPGVCEGDWEYMEIMGIAFDHRDVLWATAMRGFSPCGEGELAVPVMRVDIDAGTAILVGSSILEGQSHGGDIAPKTVTVCHLKGNGSYQSIVVSLEALAAHLAHGDVLPGPNGSCNDNGAQRHTVAN
jgi:hypothetical protein